MFEAVCQTICTTMHNWTGTRTTAHCASKLHTQRLDVMMLCTRALVYTHTHWHRHIGTSYTSTRAHKLTITDDDEWNQRERARACASVCSLSSLQAYVFVDCRRGRRRLAIPAKPLGTFEHKCKYHICVRVYDAQNACAAMQWICSQHTQAHCQQAQVWTDANSTIRTNGTNTNEFTNVLYRQNPRPAGGVHPPSRKVVQRCRTQTRNCGTAGGRCAH